MSVAQGPTALAAGDERVSRRAAWPTVLLLGLSIAVALVDLVVRLRTPSSGTWDRSVPVVLLAALVLTLAGAVRSRPRLPRTPWGEAAAEVGFLAAVALMTLGGSLEAAGAAPMVSNGLMALGCVATFGLLARTVVRYRRYGRLD